MYFIEFKFEDGTLLRVLENEEWWPEGLAEGHWEAPFPNEPGNSTAFGLVELFSQSDTHSMLFSLSKVTDVAVSKES